MELIDTDHKTTIPTMLKERNTKLENYSRASRDVRRDREDLKKNKIEIL